MNRAIPLSFLLAFSCAWAQPSAARLQFEVVSVKPAAPPASMASAGRTFVMRVGMSITGNRLEYPGASLRDLIRTAYNVKDYQLTTPEWMSGARFDVEARLPKGATAEQVP